MELYAIISLHLSSDERCCQTFMWSLNYFKKMGLVVLSFSILNWEFFVIVFDETLNITYFYQVDLSVHINFKTNYTACYQFPPRVKEMFYLTMPPTHFIYYYIASDHSDSERETHCHHYMGYSFHLAARDLL